MLCTFSSQNYNAETWNADVGLKDIAELAKIKIRVIYQSPGAGMLMLREQGGKMLNNNSKNPAPGYK